MASTSKSQHNTNCSVYGCHSRKGRNRDIHFHYFPKKQSGITVKVRNALGVEESMDKRQAWEQVLLMGKKVTTKSMRVCSKHFKKEDYCAKGVKLKQPKLLRNAVPSLNIPKRKVYASENKPNSRLERLNTRHRLKEIQNIAIEDAPICEPLEYNSEPKRRLYEDLSEDEKVAVHNLLNIGNSLNFPVHKEVQVTSGDIVITFGSTIEKETTLNSLTGISTFKLLDTLISLVNQFYPDKKIHKLSVKDRILLTFMKLKMALKFNVLSFLFKISPSLCKLIFVEYISYLSYILKSCIHWPSFEEIQRNIPACMQDFKNVRIVLDCMEIPIEKPKCLCCRVRTYSHYKGKQTIKIMTGVSPAGLITFLSKCYGGRSSDKSLFMQSNVIYKLQPGRDSIMVDKGFLIDDICNENFIKLIRPHFLRKKKQFSETESRENILISRARVHIERVNQRMRIFNILNTPLPNTLIPLIDNIMLVICGIVNLQAPILAPNKF